LGFAAVLLSGPAGLTGCEALRWSHRPARGDRPIRDEQAEFAAAKGLALAKTGDYSAALAQFERAIAINPRLTIAYIGVGDIHRQQGDYDAAERSYSEAASLEPRNFDAQYLHGVTLHVLKRLGEAVRAYLRALTIRPNNVDANLNLATAYLQLHEAGQALPYARHAVQRSPDRAQARVNLAAVYRALDRHAEAVAEYQQAAELMDLTPELLLNMADSLGKLRRYAEMQTTLDELIKTSPSAIAWERLGSALFRQKRYDEALEAFNHSLEMDKDHYPALNGVGVCLLNRYVWSDKTDQQSLRRAIQVLRRSLQIHHNQPRIVELLTRYG